MNDKNENPLDSSAENPKDSTDITTPAQSIHHINPNPVSEEELPLPKLILVFIRWSLIAVTIGIVVGVIGSAFYSARQCT